MAGKRLQFPGQEYTFIDKRTGENDRGVLPSDFALSNEFAKWSSHPDYKHGGCWSSRKFINAKRRLRQAGLSTAGLLGRMKNLRSDSRTIAKRQGYFPILTSPEEMVLQWEKQKGVCLACSQPLIMKLAHYDHNHETGTGRGFVHRTCNHAEGQLKDLSDEAFLHFVKWMRPSLLNLR